MEYHPRYAQPFTLTEAVGLDVPIIIDEIARLHNSLKHLRDTQNALREYQATEEPGQVDVEVQKALEENEVTIGSQSERVTILKLALTEKGVLEHTHYEIPLAEAKATVVPRQESIMDSFQSNGFDVEEGEGIHL